MTQSEYIYISDFCMIQKKYNSADTIVAFSAWKTPRGKFRFTKALKEFDGNVIYVNSSEGSDWYLHGIQGLGENCLEAASSLKKLIHNTSGTKGKVVTIGGSMGGFGAVLYGSLINAEYSFASGVELILQLFRGHSVNIEKKISTTMLNQILSGSLCRHHILVGANDSVDMLCHSYYKDVKNINWYVIKDQSHEVIEYIHKKYGILNLVEYLLLNDELIFENHDIDEIEYDYSDYIEKYLIFSTERLLNIINDKKATTGISFFKILLKNGRSGLIVALLKNKEVIGNLSIALIYLEALVVESQINDAEKVYNMIITKSNNNQIKQCAETIAKKHKLFSAKS